MLKQTIRPEFLNRIDELILFQPLMKKEIRAIIDIQLNALRSQLEERGIPISFSAYAVDYLTEHGFDPQFGARPLKRLIQKSIVNPLSKKLLERDYDSTKPLVVDVFDGVVVFRNQLCPEIA
jgi:ATP-dependent Clp protease ATP-binding subunit ClpB